MPPSDESAFVFILVGVIVLVIALIRPKWLDGMPGNHWFAGLYRAGRFGSIAGALSCILAGTWKLGLIPEAGKALALGTVGMLLVSAAIYDFAVTRDDDEI